MATVTRENIGLLTDKIVVNVSKGDYLPSFEKSLKQYGKQANIPGFRKGMVPSGLIKKMYGNSVFTVEDKKDEKTGKTNKVAIQHFVRLGRKQGDYVDAVSGLKARIGACGKHRGC